MPNRYQRGIESILRVYPEFRLFTAFPDDYPYLRESTDPRYPIDLFRIWWLAQHPDTMWIDLDCIVERQIQLPETDKPVFGEFLGSHDLFLIHTKKVDYCRKILYDYNCEIAGTLEDRVGCIQRLINDRYRDQIELLPQVDYKHTSLTIYGDL